LSSGFGPNSFVGPRLATSICSFFAPPSIIVRRTFPDGLARLQKSVVLPLDDLALNALHASALLQDMGELVGNQTGGRRSNRVGTPHP
jgi:hypothetical protein